jgi:DNA-3-methyladenine glycosylase II
MMAMSAVSITPRGPFSLAASTRFLEGFTPAGYRSSAADGVLRLAFPTDDGQHTAGVALRQTPDGTVRSEVTGEADPTAVAAQVARILSLDVDGTDFPRTVAADPVAERLTRRYPGLRPVCFYSPYEAAAWAIIGQRIRITQAAQIKAGIAQRCGQTVIVAGAAIPAFPTPALLRTLDELPGLPETKTQRLHAVADAALAGDLDPARLRAMSIEDALAHLQTLSGIGPFSAELILIRGAGHPDVFPTQERRLHRVMAETYQLHQPTPDELRRIAERWSPFRSWVALHLRTYQEETTQEIARPSGHRR